MKKILAMLCLICLLMTVLPLGALAEETETTAATQAPAASREPGCCGDSLTWSFSGDTLTISGSGEMDDYISDAPPWASHKHDIKKLVFTGGVTYVGAYAFTDYDDLETVDFGASMHTIGEQAFYSCDGLTSFVLPASFRCFGQECFMACQNLESIYCEGGMPSFRGSCLWDTAVTVYYPPNNPWPVEPVQQLLDSFQWRITIQAGTAPARETSAPVQTRPTEPPATQPPTQPEATEAPVVPTVPVTEATVPVTEPAETEAPTVPVMTEPEWLYETYGAEEPEEADRQGSLSVGLLVGACIVLGIFCLLLIGILVFRRRDY